MRPSRLIARAALALLLPMGSASAQTREAHLPGAVTTAPAWLKPAPFDVNRFFKMPPPDQNAAPLYLEALAEFDDDMIPCLPKDRRPQGAAVKERRQRFLSLYEAWSKDPASVSPDKIKGIVSEYREGLRRLAAAQARPQCVFAPGISYDSLLPHAQAARVLVRLLALKTRADLDRNDPDQAINNLRTALRFSRDLRPRGPSICQLVSSATGQTARQSIVLPILSHPKVTTAHCDRVLRLLDEHEKQGVDPWVTGIQADYVTRRMFLRLLETGRYPTADESGQFIEKQLTRDATMKLLADLLSASPEYQKVPPSDLKGKLSNLISTYNSSDFIKERGALDDLVRALVSPDPTHPARQRASDAWEKAHPRGPGFKPPTLIFLFLPSYGRFSEGITRGTLSARAGKCLASARRWQLTHAGSTGDLAAMCRAAGLPGVPSDPFSGQPLRLVTLKDQPVVYSVGPDGRDNQGLVDADTGNKHEGDFLFPLPPLAKPGK